MKSSTFKTATVTSALCALFFGGLAAAWTTSDRRVVMDELTERGCLHEIRDRTPLGRRSIQTLSYKMEGALISVAKGSLETRTPDEGWTKISWHCRAVQAEGRVVHMEFGRLVGSRRILAAAAAF